MTHRNTDNVPLVSTRICMNKLVEITEYHYKHKLKWIIKYLKCKKVREAYQRPLAERKWRSVKKVWFMKSIALCKNIIKCNFQQFSEPKQQGNNISSLSLPLCLFVRFWFVHSLFWDITPRCFLHSVLSNFLSASLLLTGTQMLLVLPPTDI